MATTLKAVTLREINLTGNYIQSREAIDRGNEPLELELKTGVDIFEEVAQMFYGITYEQLLVEAVEESGHPDAWPFEDIGDGEIDDMGITYFELPN